MFKQDQTITCPVCAFNIPFDVNQLLLGTPITCVQCKATIGLAESSKPMVADIVNKAKDIYRNPNNPS